MKSKSHIFMANLIREKILRTNGRVNIDGKRYQIPEDSVHAILYYPEQFRAGAVGPDFYPDMLFGQMKIHPSNSGVWLYRLQAVLSRYNKASDEYYPAYAFYLGYLMHYATDLFGHEDVNYYAGGFFPSIADLLVKLISIGKSEEGKEDLSIIIRHMMVETYMDNKVPSDEDLTIDAPLEFLKRCFGTYEAYEFMRRNNCHEGFLNVLPELIKNYTFSAANNDAARTIEKREEYINGWFNIWNTFAKIDIKEGLVAAYNACEEPLLNLLTNYALSLINADGAGDAFNIISEIFGIVEEVVLTLLTAGWNKVMDDQSEGLKRFMKEVIIKNILKGYVLSLGGTRGDVQSFAKEKEFITNIYKDPRIVLDNSKYCEKHIKKSGGFSKYLDKQWGNFGKERSIEKQDYLQFKRCLKMGLLCVMGANNLSNLFYDITSQKGYPFAGRNFEYGTFTIKISITMRDKFLAGTNDDVFLEIGDGRDNYKFPLDHGVNDVFERTQVNNFEIVLPRFLPFSELKSIRLVKEKGNDAYFLDAYVWDKDTGILLGRAVDFDLTNKVRSKNFTLTQNIEGLAIEAHQNGSKHIAGIYMLYFADDIKRNSALALVLPQKLCNRASTSINILHKSGTKCMGVVYFPIFGDLDYTRKVLCTYLGKEKLGRCYFYEGTNFQPIGYLNSMTSNVKPFELELKLGNRISPEYIYKTKDLYVIVKTADSSYAGTNDTIYLDTVVVTPIENMPIKIKPLEVPYTTKLDHFGHNDHEIGAIEVYKIELANEVDLSTIKKFVLRKEDKRGIGDWTFEFISIVDLKYNIVLCHYSLGGNTVLEGNATVSIDTGDWKVLTYK